MNNIQLTSPNLNPKESPCATSPSAPAWKQPALPGIHSDGLQSDSPKSNLSHVPSSNTDSQTYLTMDPSPNTNHGPSQLEMWTSSLGAAPASHFQSPVLGKECKTPEATSPSPILDWLTSSSPSGSFMKTCQVCSVSTEDGILVPSSGRWGSSAMGGPTECWTLNISEAPRNVAGESSSWPVATLSQVLETGELPQRFYLSPKACAGILRRAAKRGKALPPMLEAALRQAAKG